MLKHRWAQKTSDLIVMNLATGCGLGCSPIAPGTVGSLPGLVLVWSWQQWQFPVIINVLAAAAGIVTAIPICSRAAEHLGRHDPPQIVLDEIVAFPVVFAVVPVDWKTGIAGFLLFRLFDISKLWPLDRLEKLPGGGGILADDLAAGVYAGTVLWLTAWLSGW